MLLCLGRLGIVDGCMETAVLRPAERFAIYVPETFQYGTLPAPNSREHELLPCAPAIVHPQGAFHHEQFRRIAAAASKTQRGRSGSGKPGFLSGIAGARSSAWRRNNRSG